MEYSTDKTKTQSAANSSDEKVIQNKARELQDNRPVSVLQKKVNNTGLPDNLKSGIENLSGHSMDDVKVHYNSDKPAQLNAHAYAQGTNIHLASGQEKHLPHEAWHVVQQKQGRVKPTLQMKGKVNVNDDKGLEKEADVMGAKALQFVDNGSQKNVHYTNSLNLQTVRQLVSIKLDNGTYYPDTHATGQIVESDDLTSEQRGKANTDLQGNAVLINSIRNGWKHIRQNIDPIIDPLLASANITDEATKIKARRLYRESQNTGGGLTALLDAQKEWQNFLSENAVPMPAILSVHRSFGFEYEFATWELAPPNTVDVPSHTEVGKSAPFSPLFNTSFILETDAQKELELVAPPLLAGGANGIINKAFISQVHTLFINALVAFRGTHATANTHVNALPFNDHIGTGWNWTASAGLIRVATARNKWAGKTNQIGYQLNIALTPHEITEQFQKDSPGADNNQEAVYNKILKRFHDSEVYKGLESPKTEIDTALLLLAKGISNAIAIPTLSLVAKTRKPWFTGDLHSHVKDLHGIWVKDNVPNITLAAVKGNHQAQNDLRSIILSEKDKVARDILTSIPQYTPPKEVKGENTGITAMREAHTKLDTAVKGGTTSLKKAAETEAIACLTKIAERLENHDETPAVNAKTDFLAEKFGTGDGVRKDTYANIPVSGNKTLHLAELRTNATTDAFLR